MVDQLKSQLKDQLFLVVEEQPDLQPKSSPDADGGWRGPPGFADILTRLQLWDVQVQQREAADQSSCWSLINNPGWIHNSAPEFCCLSLLHMFTLIGTPASRPFTDWLAS